MEYPEEKGPPGLKRTGNRRSRKQDRRKCGKGKILALFLLIVTGSCGGIFLASYNNLLRLPDSLQAQVDILPDSRARNGTLHPGTAETVEEGTYQVVLNQLPTIPRGTRACNIRFENPEGNHYSSRLGLYLKETGVLLGSTKLVEPGQYIETLDLNQELPAGEYPVIARIELFTGKEPSGSLQVEVVIRITETGGEA